MYVVDEKSMIYDKSKVFFVLSDIDYEERISTYYEIGENIGVFFVPVDFDKPVEEYRGIKKVRSSFEVEAYLYYLTVTDNTDPEMEPYLVQESVYTDSYRIGLLRYCPEEGEIVLCEDEVGYSLKGIFCDFIKDMIIPEKEKEIDMKQKQLSVLNRFVSIGDNDGKNIK